MADVWKIEALNGGTDLATLDDAGNLTIAGAFTSTPVTDFAAAGLATDVIAESTAATGVTIDALLIKDGFVVAIDNQGLKLGTGTDDTIAHNGTLTTWTHVVGSLLVDNQDVNDPTIFRLGTDTSATAVIVKNDSDAAMFTLGADGVLTFGSATAKIVVQDAAGAALTIEDAAGNDFLVIDTAATDGITLGNATTNPPITVLGTGGMTVKGLRPISDTGVAITGACALTLADSGGVFSVSQAAAYDVDLPNPTAGPGWSALFYLTAPAANDVTISVLGAAATFVGTIVNDVTSVIPATGATLKFVTGVAVLGDNIRITSIATNLYLVQAVSSAAGGITIA